MRRKFLAVCGALVLAAVLGGLGGAALAATPPAINDTYVIDGITYYNVNSANFDSDKKFYEDVFKAKHSSLGGLSMGDLWMLTAVGVGKEMPQLTNIMGMSSTLGYAKEATLKGVGSGTVTSGGINYYYEYTAPQWYNSGNSGYVETTLHIQPEFGGVGVVTLKVRFSDFGVGVLLPGDTKHYVSTTVENDTPKGETPAASARNDSGVTATLSQGVSKTISAAMTSTINHSFSYGFTEGVKVAVGFSGAVFTVGGELSFSASQTITDGWSKSESSSQSKTINNSVSVTLPPYTTAMIKQGESNTTVTTNYNCPVMLSYKVEIIYQPAMFGDSTISFSRGANENLKKRAITDVDYDPERIDWRTVLEDSDIKDAVEKITTHVPMSATGAKMVYTDRTIYNEVSGFTALYPLSYITLGDPNVSFIKNKVASMNVGDYSYTSYLPISGYNDRNAAYYGFDAGNGEWRVVDENEQEMAEADAPVVLSNTSNGVKYQAVKPGKCYLKYFISETAYRSGINSNAYTKNSDLTRTAMLEVNVAGEKVTYQIEGEYNGRVNATAESIEGDGKLDVYALDTTGVEVDAPHSWQSKELKSRGITLAADGTVSFTKPGTFHVRVFSNADKNVYSDWKAITAEVLGDDDYVEPNDPIVRTAFADGDTQFVITGHFVGGVNVSESIEGEGKFQVETHTSSGQETPVQYTWEAQETDKGITIDEKGLVSFANPGVYHVRVREGDFHSAWIPITAREIAPARLLRAPSVSGNYYNGKEQTLLNGDELYEGGVSLFYGLGKDSVTPPEEYSTELPTATAAGTYYVWCKVQGDEDHTDSDPVCVIAEIHGSGGGDGGSGSGKGAHSGCDTGLGGLAALGLASLAVVWRKK